MNIRPAEKTSVAAPAERPLVRIVIVGHVDHGKSTLIGRLLHETGSLPEGKFESLKAVSARRGMPFEWSFLLDALQTERDQGITIDTTQIRFRTASRDIVLIDAPGHTEFLRNMITGASQADAAFLIIDAAEGVRDQTRRHGYLLHLLGIRQVTVVINKMDRIDYDEAGFRAIEREISDHLTGLGVNPIAIVPISARNGDFVSTRSDNMAWYKGHTVLEALDSFTLAKDDTKRDLRLPVQAVYKFDDRRIIAGRIESGSLKAGDEIVVSPSGKIAKIKSVEGWPQAPANQTVYAGQPAGITLDRELFVQRGDVLALSATPPKITRRLRARIFWLHNQPLNTGKTLTLRLGTAEARGQVAAIHHAVDPGELADTHLHAIGQNHVGEIEIALANPIALDLHDDNPRLGRLVLETGGRIVGGGLVIGIEAQATQQQIDIVPVESALSREERQARYRHKGAVLWLTGLPGAGKTTLARALERSLFQKGGSPILLDGDTLRAGLNSDLGFSAEDRSENIRRLAEIATHLARNDHIAIVAAVSPARADRDQARKIAGSAFFEIYVATPAEICESRDPKGHYAKARAGQLPNFTGTSGDYQPPDNAELVINTQNKPIIESLRAIEHTLTLSGILFDELADPAALI